MRREGGQASVELVALLPLLVVVVLAAVSVLAAGAADEAADAAAEAGAVALLQDRDPEAAARAVLSGWPRGAARVAVAGGVVRVTLRPKVPLLAERLVARASARAGAQVPQPPERGGDGDSARPGAHG